MNVYANQVFSVLLGWIKSGAAMLYDLVSGRGDTSFLSWAGEHWRHVLLAILIFGTAADLAVYWIRWRPYRVWMSFFRRMNSKAARRARRGRGPEVIRRVGAVPADDAYIVPDEAVRHGPQEVTYLDPQTDIEYEMIDGDMDISEDVWLSEEEEEETGEGGSGLPVRRRRQIGRRRESGLRRLVRTILADPGEEKEQGMRYIPQRPAVDSRDAYGEPFIPPTWKKPEDNMPARRKRRHTEDRDDS